MISTLINLKLNWTNLQPIINVIIIYSSECNLTYNLYLLSSYHYFLFLLNGSKWKILSSSFYF